MNLVKGLGLQSDSIRLRVGFDGSEDDELLRSIGNLNENDARIALVVNTYYPEFANNSYLNSSIYGIIGNVLESLGLFIICEENYSKEVNVPIEEVLSLREDNPYLLVTSNLDVNGKLQLWHYTGGWGGEFYREDQVLDFILPVDLVNYFCSNLKMLCEKSKVNYHEYQQASPKPTSKKNVFYRMAYKLIKRYLS